MADQELNPQILGNCSWMESDHSNGKSCNLRMISMAIKSEYVPETEDGTNITGKENINVSNFTEYPFREIKTEEVDVEPKNFSSADKHYAQCAVVSNLVDAKLHEEKNVIENEKEVSLVNIRTKIENHRNRLFETVIKLDKIDTKQSNENLAEKSVDNNGTIRDYDDSLKEEDVKLCTKIDIEDHVEGTEGNIEENEEGTVETLVDNHAAIEIHDDSSVDICKLHKEEDIEDYIEESVEENVTGDTGNMSRISVDDCRTIQNQVSIECEGNLFPYTTTIEPVTEKYHNFSLKSSVILSNTVSAPIKFESNPIVHHLDGSEKSKVYYDSSRIELADVSVIVEDLFLKISRLSQKPVQKHTNSKSCLCLFCTGMFKTQWKLRHFMEGNARKKVAKSGHFIENRNALASKKWNFCTLCPARFRFMFHLKRHSAINHRTYLCSECGNKFQLESDLRNHLKTHPVNKSYCCVFCCFKGRVEAELEIHARIHSTERFFSCGQCQIEFSESYNLLDHIQKRSCPVVTVKLENEIGLSEHSTCIGPDSRRLKTSPLLTFSYKSSPSYTSHVVKMNQAPYQEFNLTTRTNGDSSLNVCSSLKFSSKSSLHSHSLTLVSLTSDVQNQDVKPQDRLINSAKVNEKATESNYCAGENLGQPANKKWHSCTLCPARFRFTHSLTRHCVVNHRVYLCSECPSQFQRESDLQTHFKIHPGNKAFLCAFCSFKGRIAAELEIHARFHSKEKLFSCALCLADFDKMYSLLNHVKEHLRLESMAEKNLANLKEHLTVALSNSKQISVEEAVVQKDNTSSDDGVPSISGSLESEAMFNTQNNFAKKKKVGQRSVSSSFAMSPGKKPNNCYKEKSSQFKIKSKEVCANLRNELNSQVTVSSSRNESIVLKGINLEMPYFGQKPRREYFDSFSTKLVPVSVVLEDLFQKIPLHNAEEPIQKHINSKLCLCVFCTRTCKLHNGIMNFTEIKVSQNTKSSNVCSEGHVGKSMSMKWHSCTLCPAQFRFMHNLRRHSALNHHVYLCRECPRKFQLQSNFKNHLKTHSAEKLYFCELCTFKCNVEVELKMHARVHSNEKLFSCAQCFVDFDKSDNLLDHVKVHTNRNTTVKFKTKTDFPIGKHTTSDPIKKFGSKDDSSKVEPPTSPTYCFTEQNQAPPPKSDLTTNADARLSERNSSTVSLSLDLTTSSSVEVPSLTVQCFSPSHISEYFPSEVQDFDSFKFKQTPHPKPNLTAHVSSPSLECISPVIKSTANPQIDCLSSTQANECFHSDIQNFNFKILNKHKSQSSVPSEKNDFHCTANSDTIPKTASPLLVHLPKKPYICAICTTAFRFKGNLKQHIARHSNEKPFACLNCTATFKSKQEVKTHMMVHSEEKPFFCQHCDAKFKSKARLRKHLLVHSSEKKFSCALCDTKFKTKYDLKKHSVVHSTERPFACSFCTRTFKKKSQLKIHSEIHSDVKPFSCTKCASNFTSKLKLRRHFMCHSTTRPFSCSRCNAVFKKQSSLNRHSEVHLTERMFSCEFCPATFKSKRAVTTHLPVHSADKPFSCPHCFYACKSKSVLKLHLAIHSSDRPFTCEICSTKFKCKKSLKNHLLVHSSGRPFACQICNAKFKKQTHLNQHLATHSGERLYSCALCTSTFKSKKCLVTHLPVHSTDRPFSCPHCNKAFKARTHLNQHLPIHSEDRPFACINCEATFKAKRDLKSHSTTHFTGARFPCPHCDATFKTKQILRHHLHVHSNERPFACSYCKATFKTMQILKQHSAIHANEKKFACNQCPLTFKCKRALKSHFKKHSTDRPFSCSICTAAFKSKSELKTHSIVHSNQRPFLCDRCDATFKSKNSLNSHQKTHLKEKVYACAHCDAKFVHKALIKSHLIVHATAKPFGCKECNATFKSKLGLKVHAVTHSDERPFACPKCGFAFKTKTSLREHLITHSTVDPYPCPSCPAKFRSRKGLKYHSALHSSKKSV